MIVSTLCNTCFQRYTLNLAAGGYLLSEYQEAGVCPCPRLCGGKILLSNVPLPDASGFKDPIILTALDLYQAVHGAGLPDEHPKDAWTVECALMAHPVKAVKIEEDRGRLYLHELHLDDGSVVHLTSGARGAQVLKVTKGAARGG